MTRIDQNDARAWLNPIAMHALSILEACEHDVGEALMVATIQYRFGYGDPKHWQAIYRILNGERGNA